MRFVVLPQHLTDFPHTSHIVLLMFVMLTTCLHTQPYFIYDWQVGEEVVVPANWVSFIWDPNCILTFHCVSMSDELPIVPKLLKYQYFNMRINSRTWWLVLKSTILHYRSAQYKQLHKENHHYRDFLMCPTFIAIPVSFLAVIPGWFYTSLVHNLKLEGVSHTWWGCFVNSRATRREPPVILPVFSHIELVTFYWMLSSSEDTVSVKMLSSAICFFPHQLYGAVLRSWSISQALGYQTRHISQNTSPKRPKTFQLSLL